MTRANTPTLKRNANEQLAQNSYGEQAFRGEYTGTSLIYRGLARPGAIETDSVWQIAKFTYDVANNVTKIEWPENPNGTGSSEYRFDWSSRAGYTYV
jgi:hypothetical protein